MAPDGHTETVDSELAPLRPADPRPGAPRRDPRSGRLLRGLMHSPPVALVASGAVLGLAFWFLDAGLNDWFFPWASVQLGLFPRSLHEIELRMIVVALCLAGGLFSAAFAQRLVRLERHNKNLQERLSAALARALSEFIPICSYCKNIRNEEQHWERVDEYLLKRTDAQFSHSICPECFAKHFPEEA